MTKQPTCRMCNKLLNSIKKTNNFLYCESCRVKRAKDKEIARKENAGIGGGFKMPKYSFKESEHNWPDIKKMGFDV